MKYTVQQIADALGADFAGDGSIEVIAPREPAMAQDGDLALAMDPKFAEDLSKGSANAAVLWAGADWQALGLKAAIFAARPRFAMAGVTQRFAQARVLAPGIHPTAIIDETARIAPGAAIGPYVIIGRDVVLGPGAKIFAHVSIAEGATFGADTTIYEGARIGPYAVIGDSVLIHSGAVIGADGFSFVTPDAGAIDAFKAGAEKIAPQSSQEFARIASLGSVRLGNRVEVGANTTLDRGTIRDTIIGDGTKLDNLVQVGHNVCVGQHCLLCGQVGIGGSTTIGDRVVLGGQAGVADHITIGSDVMVAGKAGVSSNVPPNRVMMGNPAIPMAQNIESYKHYRRLPRLVAKVAELQKLVSKLPPNE